MQDRVMTTIHSTLLAAWLGAAAIVAFAVAPAAFEALPTRSAAGSFVGGILRAVYVAALVAGTGSGAVILKRGGTRRALRGALVAVVATSGGASLAIAARIASLREALGPIDALSPDDPGRRAFGALHGISVAVLFAGMLAAIAAIALESRTDASA